MGSEWPPDGSLERLVPEARPSLPPENRAFREISKGDPAHCGSRCARSSVAVLTSDAVRVKHRGNSERLNPVPPCAIFRRHFHHLPP
jgi:hypothetical protein